RTVTSPSRRTTARMRSRRASAINFSVIIAHSPPDGPVTDLLRDTASAGRLDLTGLRHRHVGFSTVLHFTEYDTRVAAYALIIDGLDRVLLGGFNGSTPGWTLPGGGVKYGEQLEEAVVREVFEETGYQVELGEFLAAH